MVLIVVFGLILSLMFARVINNNVYKIKLLEIELEKCRKDYNMLGCYYTDLKDRIEILEDGLEE